MKTLGSYLASARKKKKISFVVLSKKTRIKRAFLAAIEEGNWKGLPEYSALLGFVKNIAKNVDADTRFAIALLKRDYPVKEVLQPPKEEISKGTFWGPKSTFVGAVLLVVLVVLSYLFWEYLSFVKAPALAIYAPLEGQEVREKTLRISGKTDKDATVRVNNQPVLVSKDGTFEDEIRIFEETDEIVFVAATRGGKESVVRRKINVRL